MYNFSLIGIYCGPHISPELCNDILHPSWRAWELPWLSNRHCFNICDDDVRTGLQKPFRSIVVNNTLIGLAVGDTDEVMKSAILDKFLNKVKRFCFIDDISLFLPAKKSMIFLNNLQWSVRNLYLVVYLIHISNRSK